MDGIPPQFRTPRYVDVTKELFFCGRENSREDWDLYVTKKFNLENLAFSD